MKNVKKYLPYIALAIAIVLQYYVAYNNKIPKHQNEVVRSEERRVGKEC